MAAKKTKTLETPMPVDTTIESPEIPTTPVLEEPGTAVQTVQSTSEEVEQKKEETVITLPASEVSRFEALKNSPWLLLSGIVTFLGVFGAILLGDNMWVITNNFDKPYAMLALPALAVTIAAIWLVIVFFKTIISFIKKAIFSKLSQKFWIGTTIFLVTSIYLGGQGINDMTKPGNLYGLLGYAVEIAVDTTSVFSIIARQKAVRRNDDKQVKRYSWTLAISAVFSTACNSYYTKIHYVPEISVNNLFWTILVFVILGAIPLLIIILSVTSDAMKDEEKAEFDSVEYEKVEKDRTRFLQVQLDALEERKVIEDKIKVLNGVVDKKANDRAIAAAKVQAKIEKVKTGRRVPLINFNLRKPEVLNYAKMIEQLVPAIVEKVKPEPVNVAALHAAIIEDLVALLPAPVPQVEPVNADELLARLTPIMSQMVAQSVPAALPPAPVNYDQLAQHILPEVTSQISAIRADIVEEIKASVPQGLPFSPQHDGGKKAVKKVAKTTHKQTDEDRLEQALQELIDQGKKPSIRGLHAATNINRPKVSAWLQSVHPEYVEVVKGGKNQDGQSGQDEMENAPQDLDELHHYQPTPSPLESGKYDDDPYHFDETDRDDFTTSTIDPNSDEMPVVFPENLPQDEPVLVD